MNSFRASEALRPSKGTKKDTPLRPVISILGSSSENLYRFLAPFFQKLPGANIETNSQHARRAFYSLALEDNEQLLSPDAKTLYTNLPLGEVV